MQWYWKLRILSNYLNKKKFKKRDEGVASSGESNLESLGLCVTF